jgi:hypothetical protein
MAVQLPDLGLGFINLRRKARAEQYAADDERFPRQLSLTGATRLGEADPAGRQGQRARDERSAVDAARYAASGGEVTDMVTMVARRLAALSRIEFGAYRARKATKAKLAATLEITVDDIG